MPTDADTSPNLSALMDEAARTGSVLIRRADGQAFLLTPAPNAASPLDIPGVDLRLGTEEIVAAVREGRARA